MAHDFSVPDEVRLGQLIVSVYKRMPEPEFARLNRIEERLARTLPRGTTRKKVNKTHWWIVLLLTGGLATAAWWVSDVYNDNLQDNQTMNIKDDVSQPADTTARPDLQEQQVRDVQPDASDRKDTPVIYQREQ